MKGRFIGLFLFLIIWSVRMAQKTEMARILKNAKKTVIEYVKRKQKQSRRRIV